MLKSSIIKFKFSFASKDVCNWNFVLLKFTCIWNILLICLLLALSLFLLESTTLL